MINLVAAALDIVVPFVAACEGCRLSSYMPTPSDRPTIGFGATFRLDGSPVCIGDVICHDDAVALLRKTLASLTSKVAAEAGPHTSPAQLAAMTSLAYNIGEHAFAGSSVLRCHRTGAPLAAAKHFADWNKQAGKVLPGLINRRRREAALYLGGKA